jgi:hypothetical protein
MTPFCFNIILPLQIPHFNKMFVFSQTTIPHEGNIF